MAELKWDAYDHGHYETATSINRANWKVWLNDGTVWYEDWEDNASELFRFKVIRAENVDAAKSLSQRIENVLDPPECPTKHTRYGLRLNIDTAEEYPFCPDCGQPLTKES